MDRTLVVGDVHGCIAELQQLLRVTAYRPDRDRLVLVGDVFDRGPDAVAILRLLQGLGAESVMGNHDEKFVRYHAHAVKHALDPSYQNPVSSWDAEKAAQYARLDGRDIDFLVTWPSYLNLGAFDESGVEYVVVHAGFEPSKPLHLQRADRVMRIRWVGPTGAYAMPERGTVKQPANTVPWSRLWKGKHHVVHGHAVRSLTTPTFDNALRGDPSIPRTISIDTGVSYGGRLTALVLAAGLPPSFVQVPAHRQYAVFNHDHAAA